MLKSRRLKIISALFSLALFVSIPLSCNELTHTEETEELSVQNLLDSKELVSFANAHADFTAPFVKTYEGMSISEFKPVHEELESLLRKARSDGEVRALVNRMGYDGMEAFNLRYQALEESIWDLRKRFPQLEHPTTEELDVFREALKIHFRQSLLINSMASCETELEECQGITLSAYLLRTAGCVLSTSLHPLVAISCQVANSTLHVAEQSECWDAYYECVEERDN